MHQLNTRELIPKELLWLIALGSMELLAGCATKPMAMPAPPPPTVAPLPDTHVYVYPSSGQDATQLDKDRYECHQWSVRQSGFDPRSRRWRPTNGLKWWRCRRRARAR